MDCELYRQLALVETEALSEEQQLNIAGHLETCLDCAAYVKEMNQIEGGLRNLSSVAAPDDFAANVLRCIPSWQVVRKVWSQWRVAGVAVAVLLFFGFPTYMLVEHPMPFVEFQDGSAKVEIVGQTVLVPENVVLKGDLTVYHASLKVLGRVGGNVYLVSSGYSLGRQGQIDGRIVVKEHSPWDKVVYGFRNISQEVRSYIRGAWR